jgi:ubiquitin conjugation factor E4 B
MTIDRATIRSHLLSDPNDPFNRAPLKIEDVKPGRRFEDLISGLFRKLTIYSVLDTALKEKIENFKAERMAARRQSLAQTVEDSMNTSAD